MGRSSWARAVVGLGVAQLRADRRRTLLALVGIVLAVLATTTLTGIGIGVIQTGEEKFDQAGRDVWITGGPARLSPSAGVENTILDGHELANELARREAIATPAPLSFQTVYAGRSSDDLETVVGVGIRGSSGLQITAGRGFNRSEHYAGGSFDGPMEYEVVVDPRAAEVLNVSVGDTIHVGGTLASARDHRFEVVGVSPTNSRFLGAPSVAMPLSELQTVTGTAGTDAVTLISVDLHDEHEGNATAIAADLQADYPKYDVRTNREQLQATLRNQAAVIASGVSLVVLASVAGVTLTVNVLLSVVQQQREALAAIKALGCSSRTLVSVVSVQALALGGVGGLVGAGLTLPLARGVNLLATHLTGFEQVVRVPSWILLGGIGLGVAVSLLAAVVSGIYTGRLSPLRDLPR